jgi:hypothetical protein
MNRRIYGMLGVTAALALGVSCQKDPTSGLRGGPAVVELQYAYREVIIGDSTRVTATVRDAQNNPLEVPITISTGCAAGVVSVSPSPTAPLPVTAFYVKGLAFGTSCVIATAGSLVDTMQVATFPQRISVTGPDTVLSGASATFSHHYFDAKGVELTGLPAPRWSSSDSINFATVTQAGVVTGVDAGQARITAVGVGSVGDTTTFGKTIVIFPLQFTGTLAPNPIDPGQTLKITRGATDAVYRLTGADSTRVTFNGVTQGVGAANRFNDSLKIAIPDLATPGVQQLVVNRTDTTTGAPKKAYGRVSFTVATPAQIGGGVSDTSVFPSQVIRAFRGTTGPIFDANTRAYVKGIRTFITVISADQADIAIPAPHDTGNVELRLTRLGPLDQANQLTLRSLSRTLRDQYDTLPSGNDDPTTAPPITANGDYYTIMAGSCPNGTGRPRIDDCDDYFTLQNVTAAPITVTVNAAWFTNADVDILFTNAGGSLISPFGGATSANPENVSITIPANTTRRLWLNLFAEGTAVSTIVRVRISGLP